MTAVTGGCDEAEEEIELVGVERLVFADDTAHEALSDSVRQALELGPDDARELMVKIWYPAAGSPLASDARHYGFHTDENEFPLEGAEYEALAAAKIQSRVYQDVSPRDDRAYPVLLYSHGYGGFVEENEPLFEDLVESGYVVVSIGHTHSASMVTLDEGGVVTESEQVWQDLLRVLSPEEVDPAMLIQVEDLQSLFGVPLGDPPPQDVLQRYHYTNANYLVGFQDHLNVWVQDTQFVLAQLEGLTAEGSGSPFEGLLDLSRVGAFGWSLGGAASRRFCSIEERCLASVNLDGSSFALFGEQIEDPHLQMNEDLGGSLQELIREGATPEEQEAHGEEFPLHKQSAGHATVAAAESALFMLDIDDTAHGDFALGWFEQHDFGAGSGVRHELIQAATRTFFDTYLNHEQADTQSFCELLHTDPTMTLIYDNRCDE